LGCHLPVSSGDFSFGGSGSKTPEFKVTGSDFNFDFSSNAGSTGDFNFNFDASSVTSSAGGNKSRQGSTTEGGDETEVSGADSTAVFQPVVSLSEVAVETGEEAEKEVYHQRCALYRYAGDKDPPEWVTRGVGDIRILEHTDTGKRRILLREGKTFKLRMNHIVPFNTELQPKAGLEDRAWTWTVKDFAEEGEREECFTVKFKEPEIAQEFKAAFDSAREKNKPSDKITNVRVVRRGDQPAGSGGSQSDKKAKPTEEPAAEPAAADKVTNVRVVRKGDQPAGSGGAKPDSKKEPAKSDAKKDTPASKKAEPKAEPEPKPEAGSKKGSAPAPQQQPAKSPPPQQQGGSKKKK